MGSMNRARVALLGVLFAVEEVLEDEEQVFATAVPDGGCWFWERTPGLCWEMLWSEVTIPKSTLSWRSAATEGELDGQFLERRKLLERLGGLWELIRGERGSD